VDETLTLIEKTAFLKGMDVLASVPTEALAQLAARAREFHHEAGDVVFAQGEANRGAFVIVEGLVELRRGRALVRMLRDGDAFGEVFSNEGDPHEYSGIASTHAHVLNVTLAEMWDAMLDFPEFAVGMVRSVSRRNHELTTRLLELEGLLERFHAALKQAGIDPPAPPVGELAPTTVKL
jgi:CRP-like cAMP-binding protein